MKTKELRKKISEYISTKPNGDISTYKHVKTIGYKYVTIVDLYSGQVEKLHLVTFNTIYMS